MESPGSETSLEGLHLRPLLSLPTVSQLHHARRTPPPCCLPHHALVLSARPHPVQTMNNQPGSGSTPNSDKKSIDLPPVALDYKLYIVQVRCVSATVNLCNTRMPGDTLPWFAFTSRSHIPTVSHAVAPCCLWCRDANTTLCHACA